MHMRRRPCKRKRIGPCPTLQVEVNWCFACLWEGTAYQPERTAGTLAKFHQRTRLTLSSADSHSRLSSKERRAEHQRAALIALCAASLCAAFFQRQRHASRCHRAPSQRLCAVLCACSAAASASGAAECPSLPAPGVRGAAAASILRPAEPASHLSAGLLKTTENRHRVSPARLQISDQQDEMYSRIAHCHVDNRPDGGETLG